MLTAAPRRAWAPPAPRRALTHGHTRTHAGRHIRADRRSSTQQPAGALMLSPSPLPGPAQCSRAEQPPAPGRAAGGGGEGAPESRAKLPLIRAGRGGAPTSERGLPGGGHLRTSPPTHAAVWAPSPISPAPPSFRQLRQASPTPPPTLVATPGAGAWGRGNTGQILPGPGGGGREGSVAMLWEPEGSTAADAPASPLTHPLTPLT